MVRFRQFLDSVRHRLFFIPTAFVVASVALSQLTLTADDRLVGENVPDILQTTVDSGRSMLTTIAGGLISTVTLLLTLMLVAVQLASSQLSPRTLRDWIGDRMQQAAIGFVIGTVVYCLLILRRTRTFGEESELVPHVSVLVALLLAIMSLLAVVRAVDHLTNRLRIGSVASKLAADTVAIIEAHDMLRSDDNAGRIPVVSTGSGEFNDDVPDDAEPLLAPHSGWVQQINLEQIFEALPDGATVHLATSVGSFALPRAPLAYVSYGHDGTDGSDSATVLDAIAIGDTRTMQQDIGFGILQMTDIAVRALSPGINDPNTANDLLMHLGVVFLSLWERPDAPPVERRDDKTIFRPTVRHADYLNAALDPIRHYGASDPMVAATMQKMLESVRAEVVRRNLPGPIAPLDQAWERTAEAARVS